MIYDPVVKNTLVMTIRLSIKTTNYVLPGSDESFKKVISIVYIAEFNFVYGSCSDDRHTIFSLSDVILLFTGYVTIDGHGFTKLCYYHGVMNVVIFL